MEMEKYAFENVSLLITHYNRSASLEHLLLSFKNLNVSFGEIVVSDDGSKQEHQLQLLLLKERFNFCLITADRNKGLGNNINKGQAAVSKPYTLYVQEDFEPKALFPVQLSTSVKMIKDDSIDIIRYYAYRKYPCLRQYSQDYSEMIFKFWHLGYYKFYQYSDHPHLRKSSFLSKFGKYVEGTSSDNAEYKMCLSFIKHKGRGLFYNNYTELFEQVNTELEPSTATFRKEWKQKKNVLVLTLRSLYLQYKFLKYNFDYLIFK